MKVKLPQMRWYGDIQTEITIPEDWEAEVVGTKGDELPAMTYHQMQEKVNKPVGSKTLRELAVGKHKAAIIFDDITRGTPIKELAHIVLEELHAAGMTKDNIIFICALGLHAAESRVDFEKNSEKILFGNTMCLTTILLLTSNMWVRLPQVHL